MAFMRASEVPGLAAKDPAYDGVLAVMWGEIELATTITAACIPALRRLIQDKKSSSRKVSGEGNGDHQSGGSSGSAGNRQGGSAKKRDTTSIPDGASNDMYQMDELKNKEAAQEDHASATSTHNHDVNDTGKSRKHNSRSSSKWYSVYERYAARNSDENIMLSKRGDDGITVLVTKDDSDAANTSSARRGSSRGSEQEDVWTRVTTTPEVMHHGISASGPLRRAASKDVL